MAQTESALEGGVVYAVSAFAGLGHIDLVTARLGAPDWLFALALVLSLIGLVAVVFVAAALRRGVPFRRFVWVSVGGLAVGWWLLSLIDELVDRGILGSDMYLLALVAYVLILPIGLSTALLWPVQPEAQAPEDDALVGE